ncbi:MAG: LCP family protein, partial [Chloroflexota bacterium]
MKRKNIWAQITVFILISISCNLFTGKNDSQFIFPTQKLLFPSRTPGPSSTSGPSPTKDPKNTFSLTATQNPSRINPEDWAPPYWGSPGPTQITPIPKPATIISQPTSKTFLLIGSDTLTSSFRTDTLILLNYQPEFKMVTLISIPRDLYLYIPGWKMQRINAAYYHGELGYYPGGGSNLLKDTILYNLGIQVDHIAMVNFDGFKYIVNTVGGLDIPITCPYTDWHVIDPAGDIEDENNWSLHTIGPGVTHLDGDLALWYARSRLKSTDFDRSRRQQEVIRALYSQVIQLNMLSKVPRLYENFKVSIFTDMSLVNLLALAPHTLNIRSAQIRSYFIDYKVINTWISPVGAYYLVPSSKNALSEMLKKALSPPDNEELINIGATLEIWNGTSNPHWGQLAIERLNYGGFSAIENISDSSSYTKTQLIDYTFEQDTGRSKTLLSLLGLSINHLTTS